MTAATYGDDDKTPSLLKAAWLIAVVTIFSKLIGFIRDVVIANYYGASMVSDAYFYAYQIPALDNFTWRCRRTFSQCYSCCFSKLIPSLKDKPSEELNKLYSTFMTTTILFLQYLLFCVSCLHRRLWA